MPHRPDFLSNSIVIGAHPDDELLWFNAILHQVDRVYIVFRDYWARPEIGARRGAAIEAFPRADVECLNLSEAGSYGCANWRDPVESVDGLDLSFGERTREVKRVVKSSLPRVGSLASVQVAQDRIAALYRANAEALRQALRPRLRADMNVFTHNPWGEYGHEDHVQVCRVLQQLRREIGFRLWMSNYCSERALPLAQRYFQLSPAGYVRLPTNKAFADEVADVYKRHDCWTWSDRWTWFDDECFMETPEAGSDPAPHKRTMPLNMFTIDGERERAKLPLSVALGGAAASAASAAALVAALDL